MRTLDARATRDDDGTWTIEIPELTSTMPSGVTMPARGSATKFRGIAKAAHDLAAVWLDVEPEEVEVNVTVVVPESISQMVTESNEAEAQGNELRARGAALRKEAVQQLRAQGYPLEAAASVLGVTFQRVQKIAS